MKTFKHGNRAHQKWGVRITILIQFVGLIRAYHQIIEDWDQKEFEEFTELFGLNTNEDIDEWLDMHKDYFQEEFLKLSKPE